MPEVTIIGPGGRLEGRYHQNADRDTSPIALVLHPHPQHGGTMNNKVVYSLYQTFVEREFSVLRFNFRGVGRSQGERSDPGHQVGDLGDDQVQGTRAHADTSSATSGSTATVQAEVWIRPWDSVTGMRCTRWVPDSCLSWE